MRIWVHADACPAVIKDILCRAAERRKIGMTLVANKLLRVPPSPYIRALQVPRGIDVADSHIVREFKPGDLLITADIQLAADVSPGRPRAQPARRALFVGEHPGAPRVARFPRRPAWHGERAGGPAALDNTDRKRFADQLDRFLARR